VISGLLGEGAERMYALGVSDMVQATPPDLELADALVNAESNLRNAVRSFFERIDNSDI
jgi:glycerate kinase